MSEKKKPEETEVLEGWNNIPDSEPIEWFNFENIGDSFTGVMHDSFKGKYGTCFVLHAVENGELTGVPSNAFLVQQLKNVKIGQTCRITFIEELDTGKGNPAKRFEVLTRN